MVRLQHVATMNEVFELCTTGVNASEYPFFVFDVRLDEFAVRVAVIYACDHVVFGIGVACKRLRLPGLSVG